MSLEFTEPELAAIRAEYCKGATDTQFELFISECVARNLRPGPHLVFQLRNSQEWDPTVGAKVFVKKPYWITTISALRLIAQRTGDYAGQATEEYVYLDDAGNPSVKSEIPLPDPEDKRYPRRPWVARARVFRKGFAEPMVGLARFDAYAGTRTVNNEAVLTDMWAKRGPEQLYKCAEALALRKAFPEELGSLYLAEELKDEEQNLTPAEVTPTVQVNLPPPVPKVNQVPAQPTETPRPNETKAEYHTDKVPATLPAHSGDTLVVKDAKEVALAAAPELKPASELPTPKKRGRKPKEKESPENGQTQLTEEDLKQLDNPTPPPPNVSPENQKAAQEFVESVTSFTKEEAAVAGLPEPPDPLPDETQKKAFAERVRKFSKDNGVDIQTVGVYTLTLGNKTSSRYLTVGDWTRTFDNLEKAAAAGTLKELLKGKDVSLVPF